MTGDDFETNGELTEPADLLSDPVFRERFEESAAAFEVADIVRQMRRRAMSRSGAIGITQFELAERTGLSQPRISQIENVTGRDGISYSVLRKIAYACGFDLGGALRGLAGGGLLPPVEGKTKTIKPFNPGHGFSAKLHQEGPVSYSIDEGFAEAPAGFSVDE